VHCARVHIACESEYSNLPLASLRDEPATPPVSSLVSGSQVVFNLFGVAAAVVTTGSAMCAEGK
jgi:hypothetical protein